MPGWAPHTEKAQQWNGQRKATQRGGNPGFHVLASPPGEQAPIDHINYTPATNEVHDRGTMAPKDKLNYTLLPTDALHGKSPGMGMGADYGTAPPGQSLFGGRYASAPSTQHNTFSPGQPPLSPHPYGTGPGPQTNVSGAGPRPFAERASTSGNLGGPSTSGGVRSGGSPRMGGIQNSDNPAGASLSSFLGGGQEAMGAGDGPDDGTAARNAAADAAQNGGSTGTASGSTTGSNAVTNEDPAQLANSLGGTWQGDQLVITDPDGTSWVAAVKTQVPDPASGPDAMKVQITHVSRPPKTATPKVLTTPVPDTAVGLHDGQQHVAQQNPDGTLKDLGVYDAGTTIKENVPINGKNHTVSVDAAGNVKKDWGETVAPTPAPQQPTTGIGELKTVTSGSLVITQRLVADPTAPGGARWQDESVNANPNAASMPTIQTVGDHQAIFDPSSKTLTDIPGSQTTVTLGDQLLMRDQGKNTFSVVATAPPTYQFSTTTGGDTYMFNPKNPNEPPHLVFSDPTAKAQAGATLAQTQATTQSTGANIDQVRANIQKTYQDLADGKITSETARFNLQLASYQLTHPQVQSTSGGLIIPPGASVTQDANQPGTPHQDVQTYSGGPLPQAATDLANQVNQFFTGWDKDQQGLNKDQAAARAAANANIAAKPNPLQPDPGTAAGQTPGAAGTTPGAVPTSKPLLPPGQAGTIPGAPGNEGGDPSLAGTPASAQPLVPSGAAAAAAQAASPGETLAAQAADASKSGGAGPTPITVPRPAPAQGQRKVLIRPSGDMGGLGRMDDQGDDGMGGGADTFQGRGLTPETGRGSTGIGWRPKVGTGQSDDGEFEDWLTQYKADQANYRSNTQQLSEQERDNAILNVYPGHRTVADANQDTDYPQQPRQIPGGMQRVPGDGWNPKQPGSGADMPQGTNPDTSNPLYQEGYQAGMSAGAKPGTPPIFVPNFSQPIPGPSDDSGGGGGGDPGQGGQQMGGGQSTLDPGGQGIDPLQLAFQGNSGVPASGRVGLQSVGTPGQSLATSQAVAGANPSTQTPWSNPLAMTPMQRRAQSNPSLGTPGVLGGGQEPGEAPPTPLGAAPGGAPALPPGGPGGGPPQSPGANPGGWTPPVQPQDVAGIGHRFGQQMNQGEPQHSGVDLQAPEGTPTQSPVDGHVEKVEHNPQGLGLTVVVRGKDGSEHRLGHLSATEAYPGMQVAQGQTLGRVGSTGNTTGAHLHWGPRDAGGTPTDPTPALPPGMQNMPPVPGTQMMGPPGGNGGQAQAGAAAPPPGGPPPTPGGAPPPGLGGGAEGGQIPDQPGQYDASGWPSGTGMWGGRAPTPPPSGKQEIMDMVPMRPWNIGPTATGTGTDSVDVRQDLYEAKDSQNFMGPQAGQIGAGQSGWSPSGMGAGAQFTVPIQGPDGSRGTITVNANDAASASQNATQGGNTPVGAPVAGGPQGGASSGGSSGNTNSGNTSSNVADANTKANNATSLQVSQNSLQASLANTQASIAAENDRHAEALQQLAQQAQQETDYVTIQNAINAETQRHNQASEQLQAQSQAITLQVQQLQDATNIQQAIMAEGQQVLMQQGDQAFKDFQAQQTARMQILSSALNNPWLTQLAGMTPGPGGPGQATGGQNINNLVNQILQPFNPQAYLAEQPLRAADCQPGQCARRTRRQHRLTRRQHPCHRGDQRRRDARAHGRDRQHGDGDLGGYGRPARSRGIEWRGRAQHHAVVAAVLQLEPVPDGGLPHQRRGAGTGCLERDAATA